MFVSRLTGVPFGIGPIVSGCGLTMYGGVDQRLMREAGRVSPRPPPGSVSSCTAPVYGSWTWIEPTEGRFLYDSEEKLSQMLSRMAFVASGLQAFVSSSVTGTRT